MVGFFRGKGPKAHDSSSERWSAHERCQAGLEPWRAAGAPRESRRPPRWSRVSVADISSGESMAGAAEAGMADNVGHHIGEVNGRWVDGMQRRDLLEDEADEGGYYIGEEGVLRSFAR